MQDLPTLRGTVQHNCHISDARFGGQHTLCIFLLKMREYYRWEQGLGFDDNIPQLQLGDWLSEREALWDEIEDQPFAPLRIDGRDHDPFDSDAINHQLLPHGLVYSAGYGQWCKPHFVLAKLLRHRQQDGLTIYHAGTELARDLVAPPAMTLGQTIMVRRESLRRMLWERVEEWQWRKSGNRPAAMDGYGFDQDPQAALEQMTDHELHSVTLHELGEAQAGRLLGPDWEPMLAGLPRSRAEILVRATRDHLADCLLTLPTLLKEDNNASLHFYINNLRAMRRELFPRLIEAYEQWVQNGDSAPLHAATAAGVRHWQAAADTMLGHYRRAPDGYRELIEAMEAELPLC